MSVYIRAVYVMIILKMVSLRSVARVINSLPVTESYIKNGHIS